MKYGQKKKGICYPLAFLFTLVFLGKMAGETSFEGSVDWINERKELKKLLCWPKNFPVIKTYIDAFVKCDHQEVARVIAQVLLKERVVKKCGEEPSRLVTQKDPNEDQLVHTTVDGKMLRGTSKHDRTDQPSVHLLSFYECESGIVLDQFLVSKENNEEFACRAILHPLLVKGIIITFDAIFS